MRSLLSVALLVLLVGGCDSATSQSDLAGTYMATVFALPAAGDGTVNVLSVGGLFTLVLSPDGAASGRVVIPFATAATSSSTDATFEGHYHVDGDTVVLDVTPAVPMIRALNQSSDGRLVASHEGRGAYEVVLEREGGAVPAGGLHAEAGLNNLTSYNRRAGRRG